MTTKCSDATLRRRFDSKVRKTDTCWLWTGAKHRKGYGFIGTSTGNQLTHRVSFRLHRGPIPDGLMVLHKCDTPACVNPAHLFLGTNTDNMQDMLTKGRGNKAHGEAITNSKLNEAIIKLIRMSSLSAAELAAIFETHACTIHRIRSHATWKHV